MTKEIPLTQGKVTIVDDEDFEYLNQWKWHAAKRYQTWYAKRCSTKGEGLPLKKEITMHRVIMNTRPGLHTDHINRDGLDNRRENLRECTHSQNHMNRISHRGSSSQYKGVSWHSRDKIWQASIRINKACTYLGSFHSEIEAAKVYNAAAEKLFGEFSNLNEV